MACTNYKQIKRLKIRKMRKLKKEQYKVKKNPMAPVIDDFTKLKPKGKYF